MHFDAEALQSIKRTAAQVAEKYGQQDTAVALYAETQSWDELSRTICDISETLFSQGRYQTVQGYIALIPETERQQRPWLLYWSGMSRLVSNPPAARVDLEAAYHQFERTDQNLTGLLLAGSGIIESYNCSVDDMSPTIPRGDRLQHLLKLHKGFPSPAIEAKVLANLQGLTYACPHHPLLLELEESVDRILRSLDDVAARLGVAAALMYLPLWRGDFPRVRQILDDLNPYLQEDRLPTLPLLIWRTMEADYAWNTSNRAQAKKKLQEAFTIAEEFGIHVFKPMVWGIQTYNALAAGDDREGERLADLLRMQTQHHQRLAVGQNSFYRAGIALMRGELQSAHEHALQSLNLTEPLCLPFMTGNCRVGLAKVLMELDERDKAREQLAAALEYARLIGSRTMGGALLPDDGRATFKGSESG